MHRLASAAITLTVMAGGLLVGSTGAQAETHPAGASPIAAVVVSQASSDSSYPASATTHHKTIKQDLAYNCGPTATKIVLGTWRIDESTRYLGQLEHTTRNGTDSIRNVTSALNKVLKAKTGWTSFYASYFIPGWTATNGQAAKLKSMVLLDIGSFHHGIVANVVGGAYDTSGGFHHYGGGHYLAVVGYKDHGSTVRIGDNATGREYWMTTKRLANWIGQRGYSA